MGRLNELALGLGYLLLAALATSAAVFLTAVATHPLRERRDTRRFHATARQAADGEAALAATDINDLDGELRRLIEGAGQ